MNVTLVLGVLFIVALAVDGGLLGLAVVYRRRLLDAHARRRKLTANAAALRTELEATRAELREAKTESTALRDQLESIKDQLESIMRHSSRPRPSRNQAAGYGREHDAWASHMRARWAADTVIPPHEQDGDR